MVKYLINQITIDFKDSYSTQHANTNKPLFIKNNNFKIHFFITNTPQVMSPDGNRVK
jgi:hypothetical protein